MDLISPCITCVQYREGAQYCGGVQYRWGYHEYCGEILSTVGVFSTMGGYHDKCGNILSIKGVFSTVGDIMSTVGLS